jgi:hypothetical protein
MLAPYDVTMSGNNSPRSPGIAGMTQVTATFSSSEPAEPHEGKFAIAINSALKRWHPGRAHRRSSRRRIFHRAISPSDAQGALASSDHWISFYLTDFT